ncbi:uncharacterized protein LAESUDRAFT_764554 [Laetiporus sulphureus 93-53]|uniref:Uncharacterized protein n=1 Tax=Laetiporus sulphureus 93-53 TaxID=1314785 RepID=A0A165B8H1_9APHY|nr:uncharacterized protein LAESUDRAFT_764554 [Laetiporus sulphureus 93-53]KZT00486.1 hypothetical protein LAESUDRAFT_764554 [Laetiporus sulphureus 93-53]
MKIPQLPRASITSTAQTNARATASKCKGHLSKLAQHVETMDAGAHKVIMYAVHILPGGLRSFATPGFGKKKFTPLQIKIAANNSILIINVCSDESLSAKPPTAHARTVII